jgi:hypothetical protein
VHPTRGLNSETLFIDFDAKTDIKSEIDEQCEQDIIGVYLKVN